MPDSTQEVDPAQLQRALKSANDLDETYADFDLPMARILHTDCPHYWKNAEAGESQEAYASRLANSRDVKACLTLQWFRFAFGRAETAADACSLAQAQQAFEKSGWNTRELMVALVQTEAFGRSAR